MTKPVIIAVDGLAATGKGTIARRLAKELGFDYLDTGLLYRAVGASILSEGGNPADLGMAIRKAQTLDPDLLAEIAKDPIVRSPEGSQAASKVAVIQGVRDALLDFQKEFAVSPPGGKGAVLDGRDIGTVIAPNAMVKIYVEASDKIRANRRFLELQAVQEDVTEASVLKEMQERDLRDASRDIAPAKPAYDAVHLDTSSLNVDEAYEAALAIVKSKIAN